MSAVTTKLVKDCANNTDNLNISEQLKHKLKTHYSNNLYRSRLQFIKNQQPEQKGKLNFCSNDYLGFANNAEIIKKTQELLPILGTGSGASNLICGYHTIHQDLELLIANLVNCEQAILFPSGYMANLAIADVLLNLNTNTIAIHDHNNHASILDGSRLANCKMTRFAHNNTEHLNLLLNKYNNYNNKFIFTESLFSMDGDFAPLTEITNLLNDNSVLIIDESHAFGVYGNNGQGLAHQKTNTKKNKLIMGTFGKALGSAGAFVAGPKLFIESLIQFARTYIYTTALSPIATMASLEAIKLNFQRPEYREKLFDNIHYFCLNLEKTGFSSPALVSPIQPIIIGDSKTCIKAADFLNRHGIIVTAVRAPTVAKNKARIRITLSAKHNINQIDHLLNTLKKLKTEILNSSI